MEIATKKIIKGMKKFFQSVSLAACFVSGFLSTFINNPLLIIFQ